MQINQIKSLQSHRHTKSRQLLPAPVLTCIYSAAEYFHQVAYTSWQSVGELFTKPRPLSLQGRYDIMDDMGYRQRNFVTSLLVSLSTASRSVSVHLIIPNEQVRTGIVHVLSSVLWFLADNLVFRIFVNLHLYFSVKIFLGRLCSAFCFCGIPRYVNVFLAAVFQYPYIFSFDFRLRRF